VWTNVDNRVDKRAVMPIFAYQERFFMVLSGKRLVFGAVICAIIFTGIFLLNFLAISANAAAISKMTVIIDAGHGGVDGGVRGISTDILESDLNLAVAKKLQKQLSSSGFNVVMTRTDQNALYGFNIGNLKRRDMENRKKLIQKVKPRLIISVHMNKFYDFTRRGAQVFFNKNNVQSMRAAEIFQNKFNRINSRSYTALSGDYYILNCTGYPGVILECGFLSNIEDERLLITDEHQQKLVELMKEGVFEYFSQLTTNN